MRNPEKFWDKVAKKYAKSPIKNLQAYNETMERTKTHLSVGDSVLEVGCGTGSTITTPSVRHLNTGSPLRTLREAYHTLAKISLGIPE